MTPDQISEVTEELKKRYVRDDVIIEASGGIRPDNIEEYADLDIDVISSGFITNSATSLDMGLDIT